MECELMNDSVMPEFPSLQELKEPQRQLALDRYRLIEPFIKGMIPLTKLCEENNLLLRTARGWVCRYQKGGLAALARTPRNDQAKSRFFPLELRQLVEGLYLKSSHLSFANIYRQIKNHQESQQLPYPKYRTVCTILSHLPKSMTTLAHQGSKLYCQQFDLLCLHEARQSNELWQADHAQLDILLLNKKGKPQRPWLTIIFDDYSRCIAGYELSFLSPSAMKTALCLRMAIWRKKEPQWIICGIPSTLYTDHGSDFTSAHIEQVCIDLKINLIFSQIAQPRGRGKIERFFLTLNQKILCELPGYTKNKNKTPQWTLAELDRVLRQFIVEYNHSEHSQTQVSPALRWEQGGFLPHLPECIEQLDLLLFTLVKPRQILRDGIRFQGLRYLDPVLADYVGESVIIRYDPADVTAIRVFYHGHFLCQPVCQELSHQTVGLKEIQAARRAKKQALQSEINQRLSLVDAILNTQGKFSHPSTKREDLPLPIKPNGLKLYESDD
jgi:putative transposase